MKVFAALGLGLLASAAISTTAFAADLMAPPPAAEAMTTSSDWTGLYLGVGGDFLHNADNVGEVSGILGANLQTGMFLVGLEGWLGYSDDFTTGATFWDYGVEGRAGFVVGDTALVYGSLGYKGYNAGNTFYQAGLGVEFMVSDSMSLDIDYKHNWGANNPITSDEVGASLKWHFK